MACHELPGFVSPKARTENESLVQYPSRRQAWWGTRMLSAFRGRLYKIMAVQCAYQTAVLSTWYTVCVLGWQCKRCACRQTTHRAERVQMKVRRGRLHFCWVPGIEQQGQFVQSHMGTLEPNFLRVQLCKTFFFFFDCWRIGFLCPSVMKFPCKLVGAKLYHLKWQLLGVKFQVQVP